jgi:hypothetical protein
VPTPSHELGDLLTTEYYVQAWRATRPGLPRLSSTLSLIAPGHRENINFFGFISVNIEAELAKLSEGWRPLRPTTVTESGWSA